MADGVGRCVFDMAGGWWSHAGDRDLTSSVNFYRYLKNGIIHHPTSPNDSTFVSSLYNARLYHRCTILPTLLIVLSMAVPDNEAVCGVDTDDIAATRYCMSQCAYRLLSMHTTISFPPQPLIVHLRR